TFAIGGMIFHSVNGSTTKVPVLGDLPFLGTMFSTINYTESEEELLILVTPHLVDAMDCHQLPKFLPGEETRSPDDFELFLERILEAPRCHREVCHGWQYVPAYKNGPTADMFPCPTCNGPRGACDLGLYAGPGCHEHPGCGSTCGTCGNGGYRNGNCGTGNCGTGNCGTCGNGQVVYPPASPVQPMPLAPSLPSPSAPRLQQLPERSQYQAPTEQFPMSVVPVTPAPHLGSSLDSRGTSSPMLTAPLPGVPR